MELLTHFLKSNYSVLCELYTFPPTLTAVLRGSILSKDDSCDTTLAIYIQLFIYGKIYSES